MFTQKTEGDKLAQVNYNPSLNHTPYKINVVCESSPKVGMSVQLINCSMPSQEMANKERVHKVIEEHMYFFRWQQKVYENNKKEVQRAFVIPYFSRWA